MVVALAPYFTILLAVLIVEAFGEGIVAVAVLQLIAADAFSCVLLSERLGLLFPQLALANKNIVFAPCIRIVFLRLGKSGV